MMAESDGTIEKWRHKVMSILKSSVIKCRQFWKKDIFVRFWTFIRAKAAVDRKKKRSNAALGV